MSIDFKVAAKEFGKTALIGAGFYCGLSGVESLVENIPYIQMLANPGTIPLYTSLGVVIADASSRIQRYTKVKQ